MKWIMVRRGTASWIIGRSLFSRTKSRHIRLSGPQLTSTLIRRIYEIRLSADLMPFFQHVLINFDHNKTQIAHTKKGFRKNCSI